MKSRFTALRVFNGQIVPNNKIVNSSILRERVRVCSGREKESCSSLFLSLFSNTFTSLEGKREAKKGLARTGCFSLLSLSQGTTHKEKNALSENERRIDLEGSSLFSTLRSVFSCIAHTECMTPEREKPPTPFFIFLAGGFICTI